MLSAIKEEARSLGFIAVGAVPAGVAAFFEAYCRWIYSGKHGDMAWLARHRDLRRDPRTLLEGCRTVITLAYPYSYRKPSTPDGFTVSRYAEPRQADYHHRLRELTHRLAQSVRDRFPGSKARVCVDTAPLLERSFAGSAGIGFIGKNNMLIVPGRGSYVFLSEILTTAPIPLPEPALAADECGSCTRCIDACPTGALQAPYRMDASRCLSYLTIESKRGPGPEAGRRMGNCFLGCDVCQEVCPQNKGAREKDGCLPSVATILKMEKNEFDALYGKTALARAGLEKIKENIRLIH